MVLAAAVVVALKELRRITHDERYQSAWLEDTAEPD